jgi:hypothetical protein
VEFLFSYPVTLQALDVLFHNLGNIPFLTTDSFMLFGDIVPSLHQDIYLQPRRDLPLWGGATHLLTPRMI